MRIPLVVLGLFSACSTPEVTTPGPELPPSTATGVAAPTGAPQVVSTHPADGAEVPPGMTWISVTFNQDMSTQGYSFTGAPELFPHGQGQAEWVDARTARFRSELAPGRRYAFGINSVSHKNFRSASGVPAEVRQVRFSTTSADAAPVDGSAMAQALIDALADQYSHRGQRDVDWPAWEAQTRTALGAAQTPCGAAEIVAERLKALEDPHIWVQCEGASFSTALPQAEANVDPEELRLRVTDLEALSPAVSYGRVGEQGYIRVLSWSFGAAETRDALDTALFKLMGVQGLVVDVRENSGGDERVAQYFAGHFVSGPTPYAKHRSVGESAAQIRSLEAVSPRIQGPVALLIGPRVLSSNEAFVMMMQAAGARSFGATTGGSSGNPKPHELGHGVQVNLPSWQAFTLEGAPIEGQGLSPDVPVAWPGEGDPVLQAALSWLRTP